MKKFVLSAVIATAFGSSALAAPAPPVAVIGQAANIGPWVVAGVGLSAFSVIVRAAVVGGRQHRELTSSEAIGAMALPFVWVFTPGEPIIPGNPVIPGNPIAPSR